MRIRNAIFFGSMLAVAVLATPALSKDSQAQKTDDQSIASTPSTSRPCHAYQQAADGSWTERPCEAADSTKPTQRRKASARKPDEERH
jgi:hypothetical protein